MTTVNDDAEDAEEELPPPDEVGASSVDAVALATAVTRDASAVAAVMMGMGVGLRVLSMVVTLDGSTAAETPLFVKAV